MNLNDRIALLLGRAIMRAESLQVSLEEVVSARDELLKKLAAQEKPVDNKKGGKRANPGS